MSYPLNDRQKVRMSDRKTERRKEKMKARQNPELLLEASGVIMSSLHKSSASVNMHICTHPHQHTPTDYTKYAKEDKFKQGQKDIRLSPLSGKTFPRSVGDSTPDCATSFCACTLFNLGIAH